MVKHFRTLVPFLLVQQIGKIVIARQDAQLPFLVRLQPVLAPCMFELVHRIALLIRFPLNQRMALERLDLRFPTYHYFNDIVRVRV